MKIEYDPEADAAYISIARGRVAETREISEGLNVDYDASGRVLGIEVLSIRRRGSKVRKKLLTVAVESA